MKNTPAHPSQIIHVRRSDCPKQPKGSEHIWDGEGVEEDQGNLHVSSVTCSKCGMMFSDWGLRFGA